MRHSIIILVATVGALLSHTVDARTGKSSHLLASAKSLMMTDAEKARKISVLAETEIQKIPYAKIREPFLLSARRLQADALLRVNKILEARRTYKSIEYLLKSRDINPLIRGEAKLTSGVIESNDGNVINALKDYQAAFRLFEEAKDQRYQSLALLYMGTLYLEAKDTLSSIKYFDQAAGLYFDDPALRSAILNNTGIALQDVNHFAQAEDRFYQALQAARPLKGNLPRVQIMGNIARNRLKAGNLQAAETMITQAMALARSGDAQIWRPHLFAIAAEAARQRQRIVLAGGMIEQSFAGVNLTKTTLSSREAHDTAYRIFAALDRPAEALAHLVALKRLDDEATKLATNTGTALMAARFDFANQELRIERLRAEELRRNVAAEQEKARFERIIFLIVAGATTAIIILLAWLLFTIRRNRDTIRAANDGLAVTNTALERALAAKTEFLATTSHEIRTPLNGILGMTQVMLADRALASDVRDRLGIVHMAGTTMRALVDDILDVAKMETGNLAIEHAPFDLCTALQEATPMWEAQCLGKGLAFHADLGDCPAVIHGDAARVRQIVFNLLANAVKFTAAGSVTLAVKPDRAAGSVSIAVRDTGIGIAPAQQEAIFEAFRQADASTTRRFGGTGLGLSISRNLAEAMGGGIDVHSVPGEGATFTLTLPLVECGAGETVPAAVVARCDLLVLDRNPISRAMMRSLVAPHVGTVDFVADEEEVIEAIRASRAPLLLIDDATVRRDRGAVARIAELARASGMRTVLLWSRAGEDTDAPTVVGVDQTVFRPFRGEALLDALLSGTRPLVPEVA